MRKMSEWKPGAWDARTQALYSSGLLLAYKLANRFIRNHGLDRHDAESYALCRLARAAVLYDPERGYTFSTYAFQAVLRGMIVLVKRQRSSCRVHAVCFSSYERKEEDRRGFDPADTRTPSPHERLEAREDRSEVAAMLERARNAFRSKERHFWDTLWAYYIDGMSTRQIGQMHGVSKQTVSLRLKRGVLLLRRRLPEFVRGEPPACDRGRPRRKPSGARCPTW